MKTTVAIVDDEEHLREAVAEYLELQGFDVLSYRNAQVFREESVGKAIDVAILDIAMPGEDGLSLARFIRKTRQTGIIMATAAGRPIDRIVGLEIGADDYLVKPYELRELLARIKSVLRRVKAAPANGQATAPQAVLQEGRSLKFGTLTLDLDARRLVDAAGAPIDLTAMEFDLLQALATRPNRVLSRGQLQEFAHGRSADESDRSIDIRVTRLRKKIEPDAEHPRFIKTVRGEGYVFVPNGA
ncbi:response regulator [Phreatobacter aquaticus]|uniref:Regulatory protein VirG n=1 Tax=Phreatobacter aquaticus TaxID=2570229 RepID=A0A4D7QDH2_9HYPH|nr:response regulator [Phreatobacter aquaticus]QCK85258.1 response regulator [Phreatobacter aquaticus]